MQVDIRLMPDQQRYSEMNSQALRDHFLFENLFSNDQCNFNYVDLERTMVGGALPLSGPVELGCPEIVRADYFTERREIGVMNIGGNGAVEVDGKSYAMANRDALYIGRGSKKIVFYSDSQNDPACFYLISYPAHAKYPTTHAQIKDADPLHLGSEEESNKRTIYKYVYEGGIQSCQLVMGFTEMAPGSVWNTMPAHKHLRRTEVYCYFGLAAPSTVFHLMGPPEETRHIVVRDRQAVFSPGWSIHSGAGTRNYGFIWAMGGENLDYTDMDAVAMTDIK